jgi:ABC-type bacteriocin/lantibiotic exporter with double-glycine peptidase domain
MSDFSAVKWVKQEDTLGCGIACLAMILQVSYAEAKEMFSIFNGLGVKTTQMEEFLASYGFAIARINKRTDLKSYRPKKRPAWPIKPFAGIHYCLVKALKDSKVDHFVVMLNDGTVLDPDHEDPKTLNAYFDVHYIVGVTRFK